MRLRFPVVMVALANALVGIAACSSFSTEPGSAAAEAGAGTDASDALDASGPDAAAVDASTDAGTIDVLRDSDFETGTSCTSWIGTNATLSVVATAHDGVQACQVCATDGAATFGVSQGVTRAEQLGQALTGSGYFLFGANDGIASLILQVSTISGVTQADAAQTTVAPGSTWVQAATTLVPTRPYDAVGIAVAAISASPGACFIVDDLELRAPAVLAH